MTPLCHQGEGILRLFNIIGLTKQYLVYGIILAVIVGGIAGAGYFIVYKKIMKGERRIRSLNVLWAGVFFCYLAIMLSGHASGPGFRLVWYQDDASVLFLSGSVVQFFRSRMEKYCPEYSSFCTAWISSSAGNTIFPAFLGDLSGRIGSDRTDRIGSAYFRAGCCRGR